MSGGYSVRLLNLYHPPISKITSRISAVQDRRNANNPLAQARAPAIRVRSHSPQFTSWLTREAVSVTVLMIQQKTPTAVNWLSVLYSQLPTAQIIATINSPMRRP